MEVVLSGCRQDPAGGHPSRITRPAHLEVGGVPREGKSGSRRLSSLEAECEVSGGSLMGPDKQGIHVPTQAPQLFTPPERLQQHSTAPNHRSSLKAPQLLPSQSL